MRLYLPDDVPVYLHLQAHSADGQGGFEGEPSQMSSRDYQEQAHYLEAFFEVISDLDWIDGALVWNANWHEWSPWTTTEAGGGMNFSNIRGKPAEEVIRLWFGELAGDLR